MLNKIKSGLSDFLRPQWLAVWVLCSTLLSIAGPFGTYEMYSFWYRAPYWFGVTLVSTALGQLSLIITKAWLGRRHPLIVDTIATAILTVVFTPVLYGLTYGMLVGPSGQGPSLLKLVTYTVPISLAVYTARRLFPGVDDMSYLPNSAVSIVPRLVRRLPQTSDVSVLRLSSDDHFVEVVSACATHRIRLRLSDAIEEMDGIDGFSTHRSHWVARDAILRSEKEKGKIYVVLQNGDRVPVSRKYRPQLEEAGFV
jgi:hypothetical protein